jgi:hypothetical protein
MTKRVPRGQFISLEQPAPRRGLVDSLCDRSQLLRSLSPMLRIVKAAHGALG